MPFRFRHPDWLGSLSLDDALMTDRDDFKQVAGWLREAGSAMAFTGAGISTESGIPDFRSPGGVWSKYRPVMYQDFLASAGSRHEYWRQKCEALANSALAWVEQRAARTGFGARAAAGTPLLPFQQVAAESESHVLGSAQ